MICTNCKRNLVNNSKYCPRCGYLFPSDDVKSLVDIKHYERVNYYIKDKRVNTIFGLSPYYFFLSFSYAFLKKMYQVGINSFIMSLLFVFILKNGIKYLLASIGFFFLPLTFIIIGFLFTHIYYTVKFYNLYIDNVLYRISRIEKKYYKEDDKINNECLKDGKNSYVMCIASILLFLLIVFIIY